MLAIIHAYFSVPARLRFLVRWLAEFLLFLVQLAVLALLAWAVYGTSSGFHIFLNPKRREITPDTFDPYAITLDEYKNQPAQLMSRLRLALLLNGVDVGVRLGGFTSVAHTAADVAETARALRESIRMLRAEGEI